MNSAVEPASGAAHRVFFALWPSDAIREELAACVQALAGRARGRWVIPANLHLTLWFLGAVDPAGLERWLSFPAVAAQSFELDLTVVRYHTRRRLLWIEPSAVPPAFHRLLAELQSDTSPARHGGHRRPPVAHVTLGRKVELTGLLPRAVESIIWPVDSFVLVESELRPTGACYCVRKRWPLRSMPGGGSVK